MKRRTTTIIAIILLLQALLFSSNAETNLSPISFDNRTGDINSIQASGLIFSYGLNISRQGSSTLLIVGETVCDSVVVKCGFKALTVERRLNSSSSWEDFHKYGNLYFDANLYHISKSLTVDPGYQYRVTCKHYAKKNLFSTQTISNTSNIVTF